MFITSYFQIEMMIVQPVSSKRHVLRALVLSYSVFLILFAIGLIALSLAGIQENWLLFDAFVAFASLCVVAAVPGVAAFAFAVRGQLARAKTAALVHSVLAFLVALGGVVFAAAWTALVLVACHVRTCNNTSTTVTSLLLYGFVVLSCAAFGVSVRFAHRARREAAMANNGSSTSVDESASGGSVVALEQK